MHKKLTPSVHALILVIGFAALYRVLPHPPNVSPVAAMALFAGSHFRHKFLALLVPLLVMLLSDFVIGWHSSILYVYGALSLTVLIGFSLRTNAKAQHIAIAALGACGLFFLISNFGAWHNSAFYPQTAAGLWMAYAAGVPFLQYSLLGDAVFCLLFFGGFKLYQQRLGQALAH